MKFSPHVWDKTVTCMVEVFNSTIPHHLLTWKPDQANAICESIKPLKDNELT